jgi:hypothetical protein
MAGKVEERESKLHEYLAQHVEGELLAAFPVTTGGFIYRGLRTPPASVIGILLARPVAKMRNEVTGLPLHGWLALTADHVYVFNRGSMKRENRLPVQQWPLATLQSTETKSGVGYTLRVLMRFEDGRKAIFLGSASQGLKDRVRIALGGEGEAPPQPGA